MAADRLRRSRPCRLSTRKNSSLSAHSHHLAVRRGTKRAAVALAHTLLIIVYQLIAHDQEYQEVGATSLDERERQDREHRLVRQLEKLGFAVTVPPTSPAA
jgi:transposase